MDKRVSSKAKDGPRSVAVSHARAPLDEATQRGEGAHAHVHAKLSRSLPSELAVLLAEIERLQAELQAERAKVQQLEATADIDPLTKLFNRRGFDRELKRSLAYVKRYWTRAALIYVDLDGFKPVNDS